MNGNTIARISSTDLKVRTTLKIWKHVKVQCRADEV